MSDTPRTDVFDWSSLPVVLDIHDFARALRISVRQVRHLIAANRLPVLPMPRLGGETAPLRWSRHVVQAYVDGGYRKQQLAGQPRRYFGKARAARQASRDLEGSTCRAG